MRFQILTPVKGNLRKVFAGFDHNLLLQLTPPGVKMELLRFDAPDKPGGRIQLRITLLGMIRQEWTNEFPEYALSDAECHFVDVGVVMPFPIKMWRHDHRVLSDGPNRAIINDDVSFKTGFFLMDFLLYPILWLQFRYRRPIYRRIFGKP